MVFQLVFLFVFVFSNPFCKGWGAGGGAKFQNCKHKDLESISVSQSREDPVLENLKKAFKVFSQGSMHEQNC